jgi:hypothetical protein
MVMRWSIPVCFRWPAPTQQTVRFLDYALNWPERPAVVAVVGGASSGKSTVFNNLMEGHLASHITARGHATLGLVMAVPDALAPQIDAQVAEGRLLPQLAVESAELDDNVTGAPDRLIVIHHDFDDLADILLCDTPDFTSEAARHEGDVLLARLPWFDRLIVVLDHERWFDRQAVSKLRQEAVRFGLERMVLFNRTRETALHDEDRAAFAQQARQFGAAHWLILEFRRGRGLSHFAPGTLDEVKKFACGPAPDRSDALLRHLADEVNRILNQNEERRSRHIDLEGNLEAALKRATPDTWECLTALMHPEERAQMELVARVLRVEQTREWLASQTRRLQRALRQVPVVGTWFGRSLGHQAAEPAPPDRLARARTYAQAAGQRQAREITRVISGSAFWAELRRDADRTPTSREFQWTEAYEHRLRERLEKIDAALQTWNERVAAECQGVSPNVTAGVGIGLLAAGLVVATGPGAVALTFAAVKSALAGALGQIAIAAGGGALLGKPLGRLVESLRERLIGTEAFRAVKREAEAFRDELETYGRQLADEARAEASQLILHDGDPLLHALETLRDRPEEAA